MLTYVNLCTYIYRFIMTDTHTALHLFPASVLLYAPTQPLPSPKNMAHESGAARDVSVTGATP